MKPELTHIELKKIIMDAGTQVRAKLDSDIVKEYSEAMGDIKNAFPAIILFELNSGKYLLADGFHRVAAAKQRGDLTFWAEVRKGTRADALKYALGANTSHGLRLSNVDKRNAVEIALKEWPKLSDAELGRVCAVSHTFVANVRADIQPATVAGSPRQGGDGKVRRLPPPKAQPEKFSGSPPQKSSHPPKGAPAKVASIVSGAIVDETGLPIPPALLPLWGKVQDAQDVLTYLSSARSRLRKAQESNEPLFAEVNFSSAISHIDQAYADAKVAVPFAVCPSCQGKDTEGCLACKGRGFVSKHYYDICVPQEVKDIRNIGLVAPEQSKEAA